MKMSGNAKLGACCFSGYVKPDYQEKGQMETVAGTSCYVSRSSSSNYIVIAPDVVSVYTNSKAYADRLGQDGNCTALIVDYFDGGAVPPSVIAPMFNLMMLDRKKIGFVSWLWQFVCGFVVLLPTFLRFFWHHGKWSAKLAKLENVLNELIVKGAKKIVVCGYCYGTNPTLSVASNNKYKAIVVGFVAAHGELDIKLVENLHAPGLFVCCPNDMACSDAQRALVETTVKKVQPQSIVKLYKGTHHGFTMRADSTLEQQIEECFHDTLSFAMRMFLRK